MSTARDEVLRRVRDALGPDPAAPAVPRAYRATGEHHSGATQLVGLLVERLEDYRATVIRAEGDVAAAVVRGLEAAGVTGDGVVLHAPGLPPEWLGGFAAERDDGTRTPRDLDAVAAVVTGSVVAVAETGTIALDGSPRCGRRALSLVPDVHVCVVRSDDVVQTVPEGLARLDPTRPTTLVSGPSATSDIELTRVEGVHGPRTLVVVLA